MAAGKKAKTSGKKTVAPPAPAKKKLVAKATSAGKPSVTKPKTAKVTPPARKPTHGKTVPQKPVAKVVKKPVAKKAVKKAEVKVEKKTDRLEELRKSLIKKRESIVKEAKDEISKYISGENRQLVDTALDEGDWAVVDISEDISLMRLAAHRRALHNIDESIRKIKEGTYGICEECGEEISAKRLSVLPTATLCISCQENKEQLEALEREQTP